MIPTTMRSQKSILIIPSSAMPLEGHKLREREIAHHLTRFYRVYYLSWGVTKKKDIFSRLKVARRDFLRTPEVYQEGGLYVVRLPMLRGPFRVVRCHNRLWLSRLIRELVPNFVLSASTFLHPLPRRGGMVYCYDFSDIPTTERDGPLYRRIINRHVRSEVKKADLLTAVSHKLVEYIKQRYGRLAHYLPNGTDIAKFEEVSWEEVEKIREWFGLGRKFVIGYIGYFGGWSGLNFAIEVYRKLKDHVKDAVLFIVGSGEEVDRYKDRSEEGVIFTGAVDQTEVHKYFCSIDVGILTSPLVGFRDYSFPIKVIEYSAARKMVVSTPISELKRINLPNVLLAEYGSLDEWVRALMRVKETTWDPSWDQVIEKYDWGRICRKLVELLEGLSRR